MELMSSFGISVPGGEVATTAEQAREITHRLGTCRPFCTLFMYIVCSIIQGLSMPQFMEFLPLIISHPTHVYTCKAMYTCTCHCMTVRVPTHVHA